MYDQRPQRCETFCEAKPERRRPIVHRCPSQYGAFSGCGGNNREIGGGPALVNCRLLCRFSAIAKPYPLRECPAAFAGRTFTHSKDRPMHSLLRPLQRTRVFPLASGALALIAVLALAMAF